VGVAVGNRPPKLPATSYISVKKSEKAAGSGLAALSFQQVGFGGAPPLSERKPLPIGHLLCHVEQQLAIFIVGFAQQAAKLVEVTSLFARSSPSDIVRGLPLGKIWKLRGLFTVVEELIKWAFESTRQLFERLNGRNSVTIFNTGNIAAKQARTLLDITLGEFLFFAQSAKSVTDNHGLSILQLVKSVN
jgi:hypothetical protein